MKDGDSDIQRDSPGRNPVERRVNGPPSRRPAEPRKDPGEGHSGRGTDSVLPHLREQLRMKALLPTPFPMPEPEHPGKDDHHR